MFTYGNIQMGYALEVTYRSRLNVYLFTGVALKVDDKDLILVFKENNIVKAIKLNKDRIMNINYLGQIGENFDLYNSIYNIYLMKDTEKRVGTRKFRFSLDNKLNEEYRDVWEKSVRKNKNLIPHGNSFKLKTVQIV